MDKIRLSVNNFIFERKINRKCGGVISILSTTKKKKEKKEQQPTKKKLEISSS